MHKLKAWLFSLLVSASAFAGDVTGPITFPNGSGGGTPGGTNGQIQYNNAGAFGGVTVLPLANILTCSTTQIVFDSSGVLVCSSKFTWTDSTGQLALIAPTPVSTLFNDSSASTNAKIWQWVVNGSAAASVLHEQSCTDALVCTDWVTATRANSSHPGVVDALTIAAANPDITAASSIQLTTTSGGFGAVSITASDSNPSTVNLLIGSGDLVHTCTFDADCGIFLGNSGTTPNALGHVNVNGNNASWDMYVVPSTATGVPIAANGCPLVVKPVVCEQLSAGTQLAVAILNGPEYALGAGGFVPVTGTHATSDTINFLNVPAVAGTPTGVPANTTGIFASTAQLEYDTTNNRISVYNAAWKAFSADNASATLTNKTINATSNTVTTVDKQIFTASGTWTKPAGTAQITRTFCVGAGGSGGGGVTTTSGVANSGGSGGGTGATVDKTFQTSDLGATETITIGTGATGGAAAASGTQGGNTVFGSWFTAYGGGGGQVGVSAAASGGGGSGSITGKGGNGSAGNGGSVDTPNVNYYSAGGTGITPIGALLGTGGGGGSSGNAGSDGGSSAFGANGGGAGGGVATGIVAKAGGSGGYNGLSGGTSNGGAVQTNGGAATTTNLALFEGGRGGGGGGSTTTSGTSGTGGVGIRGGGGGGGGSANTGGTAAAGGKGGDGYCAVVTTS